MGVLCASYSLRHIKSKAYTFSFVLWLMWSHVISKNWFMSTYFFTQIFLFIPQYDIKTVNQALLGN